MITLDKKYTYRNGKPARILCVDAPGSYPVRSMESNGNMRYHTESGLCAYDDLDLIEAPASPIHLDDTVAFRAVPVKDEQWDGEPYEVNGVWWRNLGGKAVIQNGDEVNHYGHRWDKTYDSIGKTPSMIRRENPDHKARRRVTAPASSEVPSYPTTTGPFKDRTPDDIRSAAKRAAESSKSRYGEPPIPEGFPPVGAKLRFKVDGFDGCDDAKKDDEVGVIQVDSDGFYTSDPRGSDHTRWFQDDWREGLQLLPAEPSKPQPPVCPEELMPLPEGSVYMGNGPFETATVKWASDPVGGNNDWAESDRGWSPTSKRVHYADTIGSPAHRSTPWFDESQLVQPSGDSGELKDHAEQALGALYEAQSGLNVAILVIKENAPQFDWPRSSPRVALECVNEAITALEAARNH